MKGWNIHWGRSSLGVVFPDFHPAPSPQGRRDFCPYLTLIGSVVALVRDGNFYLQG